MNISKEELEDPDEDGLPWQGENVLDVYAKKEEEAFQKLYNLRRSSKKKYR